MQHYAFLLKGGRIDAEEAQQQVDYKCPECQGIVRVRQGMTRAPHFFHRNAGTSCHLRLKDGIHQAVQSWLISSLGENECTRECHFSAISRVADVAYHPQKVVFEVQVSPIDPLEAVRRTLDYWSVGWHVIWLLHAATYGRSTASPFEKELISIPHYFTDIGYRGGKVWDELSAPRGRKRFWYRLPPRRKNINHLDINILHPTSNAIHPAGFPLTPEQWANTRRCTWSCHLLDDLLMTELFESDCNKQSPKSISLWKQGRMLLQLLWLRCFG